MESRLKQARLPWVKTLEQFDFTFQPGIDRKVVRELAGLAFVERSENVILLGPPGVGKTHLAIALGVKAVDAGHRVLFMPLDRLIATLMKAKQENRLERQLQQLSYARVLLLDEIGYLPMNREEASLFFRLLNRRYEKASIILTSNIFFDLFFGTCQCRAQEGLRLFNQTQLLVFLTELAFQFCNANEVFLTHGRFYNAARRFLQHCQ